MKLRNKYTREINIVKVDEDYFNIYKDDGWEDYADFNTHSKYSSSVVIGTIHENPELLGGGE